MRELGNASALAELDGAFRKVLLDAPKGWSFSRPAEHLRHRFADALAAEDLVQCGELIELVRMAAHAPPAPEIPEPTAEEIVERGAEDRRLAAWREADNAATRFTHPIVLLREIEAHGTIFVDPEGNIRFTGDHLGEHHLIALSRHATAIRRHIAERWYDRVILPADEPGTETGARE